MEVTFTSRDAGAWKAAGETDNIKLRQQMLASKNRVAMELAWQLGDRDLTELREAMKDK